MAGMERDQQQTGLRSVAAGVVDPSLAFRVAGQRADLAAGVVDPLSRLIDREAQAVAVAEGDKAAAETPLVRDAAGNLTAPDMERRPFQGAADNRRQEVLASRYISELGLDAQRKMLELRTANPDPEKFRQAAEAWRAGTLEAMPGVLRAPAGAQIGQLMGQHFGALTLERDRRDKEGARVASLELLGGLGRDLNDALRAGDTAKADELREQIRRKIDGDAASGVLPPDQAAAARRQHLVLTPAAAAAQEGSKGDSQGTPPAAPPVSLSGEGAKPASAAIGRAQRHASPAEWEHIQAASREFGLPPDLLAAVAGREGVPDGKGGWMTSSKGARGMMQVMPATFAATAKRIGETRGQDDTAANIRVGAAYLREMLDRYGGNVSRAVAAYNAGPGRVDDVLAGKAQLPDETRGYVAKVLDGAGDPTAQAAARDEGRMQTAQALLAGPGSPGWRPEFDQLTLPERQALAETTRARVNFDRAEIEHSRVQQNRALAIEEAKLRIEAAGIDRQDSPPTPVQVQRRAEIQDRLTQIAGITGAPGGALSALEDKDRTNAHREQRAQQDALAADLRDRSLIDLAAIPGNFDERNRELAGILSQPGLSLAAKATILHREAQERKQAAQVAAAQMKPLNDLNNALATGGRVDNSAAHQGAALNLLAASGVRSFADPQAAPMLISLARAGVVPQQVENEAMAAIVGGDVSKVQAFAQLFRAMRRDPVASDRWDGVMSQRIRAAYGGMADALEGVPEAERPDRVQRLIEQARPVLRGDPNIAQQTRASFGATEQEQTKAIRAHTENALTAAGLPTALPPAMRGQFEAHFLTFAATATTPALAAQMALREIRRDWQVSEIGFAPGGFGLGREWRAPGNMGALDFLAGGQAPVQRPVPRWMQRAPEAELRAPFGRGGEQGVAWLREGLPSILTREGVPEAEAQRLRLGENAWLKPTDAVVDGQRGWEIWTLDRSGMLTVLPARNAAGAPTAAPLQLRLGLEQQRHTDRWAKEARDAAQKARDQAAEAGAFPGVGQ